jgi:uncharacterized SAM-binding protein YcdF (DUF218 family)
MNYDSTPDGPHVALETSKKSGKGQARGNRKRERLAEPHGSAEGAAPSRPRLGGILVRKHRWGLSWSGRMLIVCGALVAVYLLILNIHPFLAVTHRVKTNILVVEGWVHRYGIQAATEEFKGGSYEQIFTTGGPVEGNGGYVNDFQTSASVGADRLKKAGVPSEFLTMVPSHVIGRDRTYSAAIALRDWVRDRNMAVHSINVLTEDCHARRTRFLYEKAFGKSVSVGIIAISSPDFDSKHWWRSSDGVREVIGESIAYLYATLFFYPSERSRDDKAAKTLQSGPRQ